MVAYRPKEGKAAALLELMRTHVPILRAEGLATERPPVLLRAADGTLVEIFEWVSTEAVEKAHTNPAVGRMWGEFEAACDYVKLGSLAEADQLFASFELVTL